MADIFISYAREDREWVEKLASQLVAEGFSVWWDWDLLVGKRYRETIETELQTAKAAIVVWSQHSIRSDFVRDEAEDGQQRNILLPLLKEIVRPPAGFRQLQTADLSNWNGGGEHIEFRRMMKGVSHLVGRPAAGDTGYISVDPAHPTTHFEPPKPAAPLAAAEALSPAIDSPEPVAAAKAPEPMMPAPAPVAPPVQAAASPAAPKPFAATPPQTSPVIVILAVGAVALIAVGFLVMKFFGGPDKPVTPPVTPPAVTAPPTTSGKPLTATPPANDSTVPPATGDTGGGDEGQSGPRHGGGSTRPSNSNISGDSGSNGGNEGGGDEGQAGPHH